MHYGAHPDQHLQFFEPEHSTARGAVMIIHGGYWREKYTAQLGVPLVTLDQRLARTAATTCEVLVPGIA